MAELIVEWVDSEKVPGVRYGMLGYVRAFSLLKAYHVVRLTCHLPGPFGMQGIEEFPSEEQARARAAQCVVAFAADLGIAALLEGRD
jgi:hypothetical protein